MTESKKTKKQTGGQIT